MVFFVIAVHGARQEEVIDHRLTDREWAEEWKHLDNVRIYIAAVFNDNHLFTSFKLKQWGGRKELRGQWVMKVSFSAEDGMQMTGTGAVDRQLTLRGLRQCGELTADTHLSGFLALNSMRKHVG